MKQISITLVILFILGVMIATNPSIEEYERFVVNEIRDQAREEGGLEGEALAALFGGLASSFLVTQTKHNDYLLFSTYETPIGDDTMKAVGALRQFFVLESPTK
jgi:hypothetical protein